MVKMHIVWLQVILVSLCVFQSFAFDRVKRRTGDQAPTGECMTFKWGGKTRFHWYICCNNCDGIDSSCDGTTYHSASLSSYCDTCGTDNVDGDGNIHRSFECGGCVRQNIISDNCKANILSIFNIPGFCWAFTKCFEFFCRPSLKRSADDDDISPDSFNLRCDPGEDVNSNPTDCCGTVNEQCNHTMYVGTNDCPPSCCGEPSCCETSDSQQITFSFMLLMVPIVSLLIEIL